MATISPKAHIRRQLNAAVTECRKWMAENPQPLYNEANLEELKRLAASMHRAASAFEVFVK